MRAEAVVEVEIDGEAVLERAREQLAKMDSLTDEQRERFLDGIRKRLASPAFLAEVQARAVRREQEAEAMRREAERVQAKLARREAEAEAARPALERAQAKRARRNARRLREGRRG